MALTQHDFIYRPNEIGGSEVAAILNLSKYKNATQTLADKLRGRNTEQLTEQQQNRLDRGHHMEPFVLQKKRDKLLKENNVLLELDGREETYRIKNKDGEDTIVSHPDARYHIVAEKSSKKPLEYRLLEIKTSSDRTVLYGDNTDVSDDLKTSRPPAYWEIQCQMEMHGAHQSGFPASSMDLCVYNNLDDTMKTYQIIYDEERCEEMVEEVSAWKKRYLDNPEGLTPQERLEELYAKEQTWGADVIAPRTDLFEIGVEIDPNDQHIVESLDADRQKKLLQKIRQRQADAEQAKRFTESVKEADEYIKNDMGGKGELVVNGVPLFTQKPPTTAVSGKKQIADFADYLLSEDNIRLDAQQINKEAKALGIQITPKQALVLARKTAQVRVPKGQKSVIAKNTVTRKGPFSPKRTKAAREVFEGLVQGLDNGKGNSHTD